MSKETKFMYSKILLFLSMFGLIIAGLELTQYSEIIGYASTGLTGPAVLLILSAFKDYQHLADELQDE